MADSKASGPPKGEDEMSEDLPRGRNDATVERADLGSEPANVEELVGDLESLAATVGTPEAEEAVGETRALLERARERGIIESGVRKVVPRDAAEALVGSVIFASPLLVEDGVFDIADHLFGVTAYGVPIFLVANTVFVVLITYALVEWTGRDKEEADRLLGVAPTRVVMALVVSFAVATVLMTVWGRIPWGAPIEALARVNVLWTVGSIGAALGDILSEGDASPSGAGPGQNDREPSARGTTPEPRAAALDRWAGPRSAPTDDAGLEPVGEPHDGLLVVTLYDQLERLHAVVEGQEQRRQVERLMARTSQATLDGPFGDRIGKYTTRDVAEAFVGSVVFAIPLLVEDGVFDVADYFLAFRVGAFPVFFIANAAFVLAMIVALVYWAGPQDVRVSRPLFGVVPRRLVGIAVVSFLTAAALMTMWGRVEGWQDPVVAVARISAVWTVASFGAALGDILPGESSGDDINDDLAELGDLVDRSE